MVRLKNPTLTLPLERGGDQILSPPVALARGTKGGLFREVRENRTVLGEEQGIGGAGETR